MFSIPYFRGVDFIEGYSSTKFQVQKREVIWLCYSQNVVFLILYFIKKLKFEVGNSSKERYHLIQCSCEGLLSLPKLTTNYTSLSSKLLEEIFYRAFIALKGLLLSTENFSLDIYLSLISATFSCLKKSNVRDSFDILIHKQLFDYTWSVIYLCGKAIDPVSVLTLHEEHTFYLMRQ
ncbi:hypothetical protein LSM04_002414 [Trypanosoma melophagium]|nr:hypothetical protein LSM04_002414 [Trypanosoma melophagium]